MPFLAMPVDEHVATVFSTPRPTGEVALPNILNDYKTAQKNGIRLWLVVDVPKSELPVYECMTEADFKVTYRIDEHPEFPNDWFDVSKI